MNPSDRRVVKVLIVAKLLQHTEPISISEICDYINGGHFYLSEEVTPQYVSGLIRRTKNSNYFRNIIILRRHFKDRYGVRNGYLLRREGMVYEPAK